MPLYRLAVLVTLWSLAGTPSAAQWTEAPGTGWLQVETLYHGTDTRFDENGTLEPLFNEDSRSLTTSVSFKGALGVVRGVDVWAEVPFHRLQFDDAVRERTSTGIGDPRVFIRLGSSLAELDDALPVAVAVRGGVKFSAGDFPVDAEIIPLTEGQRDWEVLVEIGRSLHPWPVYVQGWAGYRWRETNDAIQRKPGNERFVYAAAGGSIDRFTWQIGVDGLFGTPPERQLSSGLVLPLPNDVRELVQVLPTVGYAVGPGAVEFGARIPVHGQNLPAGPSFTLGYFLTWDAAPWK
jgi:hypothetical protein